LVLVGRLALVEVQLVEQGILRPLVHIVRQQAAVVESLILQTSQQALRRGLGLVEILIFLADPAFGHFGIALILKMQMVQAEVPSWVRVVFPIG
jgi:hypothetical protein